MKVLVTGGGGYVGSLLVPYLLEKGYEVRVLDLFIYGKNVFDNIANSDSLEIVEGDIRDVDVIRKSIQGCDSVIHLACISNDPSFELNPELAKSINLDAFPAIVDESQGAGVKRFIYASSSSVYGVKDVPDVTEDAAPNPLTDYSRFKLDCEHILLEKASNSDMICEIVRPATVCGYAPRLRLDLTVNILTIHALVNKRIRIFGGSQLRPNININDMIRVYETLLNAESDKVHCVPFNAGYQNHSVEDIASIVKDTLNDDTIELNYEHTDDIRSYHINSDRIKSVLGFVPSFDIQQAVTSIADEFSKGTLKDPMNNPIYYNIKRMQELEMK